MVDKSKIHGAISLDLTIGEIYRTTDTRYSYHSIPTSRDSLGYLGYPLLRSLCCIHSMKPENQGPAVRGVNSAFFDDH